MLVYCVLVAVQVVVAGVQGAAVLASELVAVGTLDFGLVLIGIVVPIELARGLSTIVADLADVRLDFLVLALLMGALEPMRSV